MDTVDVSAVDDHIDDVGVIGPPERDPAPFRVSDFQVLDANVIVRIDPDQCVVSATGRIAAGALDDWALVPQSLDGFSVLDVVRADGRIRRDRPGPVDGEL